MNISQDQYFKAAAHGLLLGCTLPILAYNAAAKAPRNRRNVAVYVLFIGFELWNIALHLHEARSLS